MEKTKRIILIFIIAFLVIILSQNACYAIENPKGSSLIKREGHAIDADKIFKEQVEESKYTEEYKEYLKLSDEEKSKVNVIPRKYKVPLDMIYEDTVEVKEKSKLKNLFGLFCTKTVKKLLCR